MTNELIIRDAAAGDFAQWKPLWDGYNVFYKRTPSDDITRVLWARLFDKAEPMHALVAESALPGSEGRLVGLAHYLFHRSTSMVPLNCYLQDLFTAESERSQGVGRALIEEVYARAKAAGSTRVYWQTHETNLTAQALYDKLAERSGFIVYRKDL
ncbi:MAG: GNAT family N-acetyltransferase [Alphaproteobacteria bacterium]|nr:GNAT family N-acetyltransferase [Alphaproteobacteria bacterium]